MSLQTVVGYLKHAAEAEHTKGLDDQELLRRYAETREEYAFAALMRRHPSSRHRAALAGHARNLTGNHPGPGCGRNRRRARASPGCDQLKTI